MVIAMFTGWRACREDMDACCVSLGLSPERVATVDGLWEMARLAEASQASPRPAEAAHANGHTRTVPAAAHHRPRGALGGFMFGYLGMTREDLVRAHRLLQGRAARVIQRRAREFLARVRVQRALVQAERAQKDRVAVQVQVRVETHGDASVQRFLFSPRVGAGRCVWSLAVEKRPCTFQAGLLTMARPIPRRRPCARGSRGARRCCCGCVGALPRP